MGYKQDWLAWYKKENPNADTDAVQAAWMKKYHELKASGKAKIKKKPDSSGAGEGLGAYAREHGTTPSEGATPTIGEAELGRARRARTGSAGGERPKRADYSTNKAWQSAALVWDQAKQKRGKAQGKALGRSLEGSRAATGGGGTP